MAAETKALAGELSADRAARTRTEMAELAANGVFIRAPEDYQKTAEERAQAAREDLAEAKAALKRPNSGGK